MMYYRIIEMWLEQQHYFYQEYSKHGTYFWGFAFKPQKIT